MKKYIINFSEDSNKIIFTRYLKIKKSKIKSYKKLSMIKE